MLTIDHAPYLAYSDVVKGQLVHEKLEVNIASPHEIIYASFSVIFQTSPSSMPVRLLRPEKDFVPHTFIRTSAPVATDLMDEVLPYLFLRRITTSWRPSCLSMGNTTSMRVATTDNPDRKRNSVAPPIQKSSWCSVTSPRCPGHTNG